MRYHITLTAVLPLFALTAVPASAQMVTITPEQIGQIFCIGSLGNDMAPVEALLSPDLSVEVANAWARNAGFVEQAPDEKPPLGDGLPWRSWQDYADGCAVDSVDVEAETAHVAIQYSFAADPMSNYRDVLVLQRTPSEAAGDTPLWRIDDILLIDNQSMRRILTGAFAP